MSQAETNKTGVLAAEVRRRRTFAIISHPDAGKTTLTEKLLLVSGMIRTAGMVGGRKSSKSAASDWMSMEQERGISITASAMQFTYRDTVINILDTPGHQDFSEDTYRTLTAADSVIMVLDAAKGVEPQTIKLFEACRLRGIPVFTFINKMDLPPRDSLELLSDVEEVLGVAASPINWPVGQGKTFQGVAELSTGDVTLYTKTAAAGARMPDKQVVNIDDIGSVERIPADDREQLIDEFELMSEAGNPFDPGRFLAGEITPVYFGSALINFGVEPLFDAFVKLAPFPGPRLADSGDDETIIEPVSDLFSAHVFKLQANMDPRHRDCVAFMRINSGIYERDMVVNHHRLSRQVRLSRPHNLVVAERETLETAFPGDIIGVMNPDLFQIGDTISTGKDFTFKPLPYFQPEHFARVGLSDTGRRKALDKGMEQLAAEGAVQVLYDWDDTTGAPIVGVVGRLQFEVMTYRLKDEYKVQVRLEPLSYSCSAWLIGDVAGFIKPLNARIVRDRKDRPMVLFTNQWEKEHAVRENPEHQLVDYA